MSVGLSGNLCDFGIADVFQLIGQQRKTGVLELRSDRGRAKLVFDQGLVVSAEAVKDRASDLDPLAERLVRCGVLTRERAEEAQATCRSSAQSLGTVVVERGWLDGRTVGQIAELVTRDTLFDVLRWESGSFDFRAEAVSHERERATLLGAEQILMDGLRMVDEWQSFAEFVPSEETVFQHAGPFERFVENAGRSSDADRERAERIYAVLDGRITARRAIDLARLGRFDGVRCLAELCQAGAIRALHPESAHRLRRLARAGSGRAALARAALAGAAPLLVLLATVVWIAASSARPDPSPGHPVGVSELAALREAYAARGVRHALEAHRLERGAWPVDLAVLEEEGLLPPGALATPHGRPYYSQVRDRGLVFLAPERSPRGSR